MTQTRYLKNLAAPDRPVDVILDTDTFNEVDDQFALSYLLRSGDRLRTLGVCAAPFLNGKVATPGEGMEKSFEEIHRILPLVGTALPVYRGSTRFLPDEKTPVESEAARFIAETAAAYSPENPLYVVAIGAVTNVASALLLDERVRENTVLVWLGGNAHHFVHNAEFNLMQDVAAARVVFGCGVPLVQLPCAGVVDRFLITEAELTHCLQGKNPLCDFLVGRVKDEMAHAAGTPWSRTIWDVTAVAWLLNDGDRFMSSSLEHSPIPEYDDRYAFDPRRHLIRYVREIHRDALATDLFKKLTE